MSRICLSVTNDLVSDQRVHRIALSLTKAGAEVTLVGRKLTKSLPMNKRPYKAKRFRLLFNKSFLFYGEYNIRLFFFLIFSKFDAYVANDLDSLAANYLASTIRRKKLIFDSHEYFTELPELEGRAFVRGIWLALERAILPRIKYSYTVCGSIANEYKKSYGINMTVVRNLPARKQSSTNEMPRLDFNGKKIILYQGVVNIGRGIEQVMDVMKDFDDAVFVIIGNGDIKERLVNKGKEIGLIDKIFFMDKVQFDQLPAYTRQADVGISLEENLGLNYYYSLPNKLFDYIQAGVPVLSTAFPEKEAIIQKYNIGLTIENLEPATLTKALHDMLYDEQKRSGWKRNLLIAADELCWENEERILLEVYQKAEILV
jgi:glycosyltransferase involved in cell wall biosynthesis